MADYLINLESDEHIVKEIRKHMFVFYNRIFLLFIFLVVPVFISKPTVSYINGINERGLSVFIFLYLMWFLVLWVLFFFRWTDYYLDVWVLTNKRIFDVEQRGFFSRSMSVFRLERIEDITINIDGILATFLKYGDIHIHTAGSHSDGSNDVTDITIHSAKNPLRVKQDIMDQHSAALRKMGADGISRTRLHIAQQVEQNQDSETNS